jgi:hypothetical protein
MYVKVSDGAVDTFPYSPQMLKRDNPNTSFPKKPSEETLASFGVYKVNYSDPPAIDFKTQIASPTSTPVFRDNAWFLDWEVRSLTADEITVATENHAAGNKSRRNDLLAETDFYALSDVTMSAEMTTYRQALRDITSHVNWPYLEEADWPTKP